VKWLKGLGGGALVGIEGADSYGAGLCEHLQDAGMQVLEVERPRRRDRRAGKSDRIDALLAAKKVVRMRSLFVLRGREQRMRGTTACSRGEERDLCRDRP
jgi:transposase